MSVKKEASGRRSVQVEVEVPGTPEEVWQAIATGPGISSWFVPAEFEERDGKPVAMTLNFGPGMESRSVVTAWEPPRTWAAQSDGWVPGSPPIANEWSVEARDGGICIVRIVHSLFASTDDWDNQLEGTESGWPAFFRTLQIYLTHFRGQRSTMMKLMAPAAGTEAEAWETLTSALGVKGVSVGQRSTAPAGVPAFSGVAEYSARLRTTPSCGSTSRGRVSPPLAPSPSRRADHGCAELLPLRRSGGRNRRPRDTALGSVVSRTLPDAVGDEPERVISVLAEGTGQTIWNQTRCGPKTGRSLEVCWCCRGEGADVNFTRDLPLVNYALGSAGVSRRGEFARRRAKGGGEGGIRAGSENSDRTFSGNFSSPLGCNPFGYTLAAGGSERGDVGHAQAASDSGSARRRPQSAGRGEAGDRVGAKRPSRRG